MTTPMNDPAGRGWARRRREEEDYLERLRGGRIDLWRDDMVRACRIAALECLRDSPTPREISRIQLRTALLVKADDFPFRDASGEDEVNAEQVVDMLLDSGVLTRNQANHSYVQFTYDPVAEELKKLPPDSR